MKKILTILVLLPLLMMQACEKRLDIVPASVSPEELILSNLDGVNGGLNFAYQQFHSEIGRTYTVWSELMADHLLVRGTSVQPNYFYFYDRNLDAIATETVNNTDVPLRKVSDIRLRTLYNCVNTVALLLRACEKDLPKNDINYAANKERIMGECYFLRAASHFELVRWWAMPWGATADNSHPGIVINEGPVDDRESQIKPRATVAQVYEFIIRDLQKAAELLPETYINGVHSPIYNGRAYKDATSGYLAKVYFQQGNYAKAKEVIDGLIGAQPGLPDKHPLQASLNVLYSSRGPENTDPECIYQTTSNTSITSSLATFWNSTNVESIFSRSVSVAPKGVATPRFLADAHFIAGDLRFALFTTLSDGRLSPTKYSLVDHYNIPLIRSAELILDRAEGFALDNKLTEAMADCNAIRSRAQIPVLTMPVTQAALLDTIRTERIRELCFEGDRLHNLKRMKLPVGPGERTGVVPIDFNSKNLVLKYTQEDMARNPQLENNY